MAKDGKVVFSYTLGDDPPDYNPDEKKEKYGSQNDGIIRIGIEKAKRGGKKVTIIYGFEKKDDINALCKELKSKLGTGGTIKKRIIEIQGDRRSDCKNFFEQKGYKVKLAGG